MVQSVTDTKSSQKVKKTAGSFHTLQSLFDRFEVDDRGGYITREFQDFGYRLALELDDLKHKSLYIKLAKENPRTWLEQARSFVIDADSARSKPRLFMWKLKQIKESNREKKTKQKSKPIDARKNI